MDYYLKDKFRVTAYSTFGKAVAYFESPKFPTDHEMINFLLDNPNCEAKIERVYTAEEWVFSKR